MRIMVLDDDSENVEILADTLRCEGFEVDEFTSPAEAMESFSNDSYEVVISDIKMPHLSGLDILDLVKKAKPDTYVILVTGFASLDNSIAALNGGAYKFFRKPLDLRKIIDTLREIENRELERRNAVG